MVSNPGIASRTLTFILAGGRGERLYPLTRDRAKPAIPFGGMYRLIDFTLSNCVNSGLRRISVLTQYQCESLHSYVRALTERSPFESNRDSLLCLCSVSGKRYRGTADAVFQNLPILENTRTEFVVILCADHVYKMDYGELLRFHIDRGAEVTVAGAECPRHAASHFGVLETDSAGYAAGFEEKPNKPKSISGKPSRSLVNMGVYVFNKRTLMDVLSDDAQQNTNHDFGRDIIPGLVRRGRVSVYNLTDVATRLGSYWRDVGTLDAYYRANMELLMSPFFDQYDSADWPLYGLDAQYHAESCETDRRATGLVVDSVVPEGFSIGSESEVIHSVLSAGVQIENFVKIHDSILLHDVRVGAGARIQRAILDDNVHIGAGVEVGCDLNRDRKYGFVTDNGIVVIPANTYVGSSSPTAASPHVKWRTELAKNDRSKTLRSEVRDPTESREIDKD
jgi:glucose-1-phosphate adenylyltransferase